MFANSYLPFILGDTHFELDIEIYQVSQTSNKRFNKPDKETRTLPLTRPNINHIVSNLKRGVKYMPSYVPSEYIPYYNTKELEVLEDKTRYCVVTENNTKDIPNTADVSEILLTDNTEHFKHIRDKLRQVEYYRFHDDYKLVNRLSQIKTEIPYLKAIKHEDNICVYSTFNDTVYLYYNSIEPETVSQHFKTYKRIVWGCYSEFLKSLGTLKHPDNYTKMPLIYIRLRDRNLLIPKPKTKTIAPADALNKALNKNYKLDRTIFISLQYFIFCCLETDRILTYYEKDGIIVFTCDIDKNCIVFADDNSPATIKEAQNICNSLGGKMLIRPEVTRQQALDPKLNLSCMFLHDKTMLDLSGGEKRELRRIYNKIERETTLEIRVVDEPEDINKVITDVINPMRKQWAKEKVKRENEPKLPVFYELFITSYYRNLIPEVLENIPVCVITIYDNNEPQALVVSEQVCKTWVHNTEAVSVSKPSVKQTRAILATEEYRYWHQRLNNDNLIVCSGVAKFPGLKQMKANHYPCAILKIVGQM